MQTPHRRRRWPGAGAFAFPVDPRLDALEAPAIWDASFCPYVMILDDAPAPFAAFDPARWPHRLMDRTAADGRHLVVHDGTAFHRIWLRRAAADTVLAAVIPLDAMVGIRLQMAAELDRGLRGESAGASAALPTGYQAHRLRLLLAILDLRARAAISSHEVARRLIYPRMSVGRGATWKASPERRRTQRLIREAEALAKGGYRALLAGRAGRQK